jgi:hypothetical protein
MLPVLVEEVQRDLENILVHFPANDLPARALYASLGFRRICLDEGALEVNGRVIDEEWMSLDLVRARPPVSRAEPMKVPVPRKQGRSALSGVGELASKGLSKLLEIPKAAAILIFLALGLLSYLALPIVCVFLVTMLVDGTQGRWNRLRAAFGTAVFGFSWLVLIVEPWRLMSILHRRVTSVTEFWLLVIFAPMAHGYWISIWTYILLGLQTDFGNEAKKRASGQRIVWRALGSALVLVILVVCMTAIVKDLFSGEVPWPFSLADD